MSEKNPLINAPLVNGTGRLSRIPSNLVGMPAPVAPVQNPLVSSVLQSPQQKPEDTEQKDFSTNPELFPEGDVVNVTGYMQAKGFNNKSQTSQREALADVFKQVNERYPGRFTEAQLAVPFSKLNGALIESDGRKIKDKAIDSSFWKGVATTGAQMGTTLIDAAAGLANVAFDTETTRDVAKWARELQHGTEEQLNSDSRKDYIKRRDELAEEGRYGDLIAHLATNPGGLLEDAAIMIGPTVGSGLALRAASKGATKGMAKLTGKELAEETAAQKAKSMFRTQMAGNGVIGAGTTAQNMGAGADGRGDFNLSGSQRLSALGKGVVDMGATAFGYKFGVTPESLLFKFGKAADVQGVKSVLGQMMGSTAVDALSNAPSGALDALLTTGFDEKGKFDVNRVDWDKVQQAVGMGAAYAPFTGGIPAGVHTQRGNALVRKDWNTTAQNDAVYKDIITQKQKLLADWDTMTPEQKQEAVQREQMYNDALATDLSRRSEAYSNIAETGIVGRKRRKASVEATQAELTAKYNEEMGRTPLAEMFAQDEPAIKAEQDIRAQAEQGPVEMTPENVVKMKTAMGEDASPIALLAYKGKMPTEISGAEFSAHLREQMAVDTPEAIQNRANALYDFDRRERILRDREQRLRDRLKDETLDAETRAKIDDEASGIAVQRMAFADAKFQMLQHMAADDPAHDIFQARQVQEQEIRAEATRRAEAEDIAGQKEMTAAEIAKADADVLAVRAAEQVLYARDTEALIARMPDGVDVRRAEQNIVKANEKAAELLRQAYRKAVGAEAPADVDLAAMFPSYEQRLEQSRQRAARMAELTDLRQQQEEAIAQYQQMQDEAMATLQTPDDLGPRDSRSRNELIRAAQDEAVADAPRRGRTETAAERAARMRRSMEEAEYQARENNLIRQGYTEEVPRNRTPSYAEGQPITPADVTASTGLSARARNFAQVLMQNPDARDPLNVGRLLRDQETRARIPDVDSPAEMVALLAERRAEAETKTSGRLYAGREVMTDVLAAYRAALPEAYEQGIASAADLIRADAEAGANNLVNQAALVDLSYSPTVQKALQTASADLAMSSRLRADAEFRRAAADELAQLEQEGATLGSMARRLAEILPAGEVKAESYMTTANPEMLTRLEMGDVFGALEQIKFEGQTTPLVRQMINILKDRRYVEDVNVNLVDQDIVVGGIKRNASYDPATHTVSINRSVADQPYYLMHELTHHVLFDAVNDPTRWVHMSADQVEALTTLRVMYNEFRKMKRPEGLAHAALNVNEFLAEAWSNPQMQAFLNTTKMKTQAATKFRKAFNTLVDAVRRFFGLKPKAHTALSDVIGLSRVIVGEDILQAAGPIGANDNFGLKGNRVWSSGTIRQPVKNGEWLTIGRFGTLQDGRMELTIDGEGIMGRTEIFETRNEMSQWAHDEYGAQVHTLSEKTTPPRVTIVGVADIFGQPYADFREKFLSQFGPEAGRMHALADRVLSVMANTWSWFWTMNIDAYAPFKVMDRIAERMGYRDKDGHPLNLYEKMTEGMAQARAVTGRDGSQLGTLAQGIAEGMAQLNIRQDVLSDYAYAKYALDRHARAERMGTQKDYMGVPGRVQEDVTGFEWTTPAGKHLKGIEAANAFMATIPQETQARFDSLLAPTYEMNQRVLKLEFASGLLSRDEYYQRASNEFYMPLLSEGQEFREKKHSQGRYTKAADPLTNMLVDMQKRFARVARNDSLRALYDMINDLGMSDLFTLETHHLKRDKDGRVTTESDQLWNDKRSVWVYMGDQKGRIIVNTDTALGKNMLAAIQKPEVGPMLTNIRTVTGYIASGMTTYNPAFLTKTPVWNTVLTLLNFSGAFDRNLSVAEHYSLATKTLRDVVTLLPENVKGRMSGHTDKPMRRLFARFGGGNNAGAYFGLDAVSKSLNMSSAAGPVDILQRRGVAGVGEAATSLHNKFVRLVHASDEVFRYSAFINYLEFKSGLDLRNMDQAAVDRWAASNQDVIIQAAKGSRELAGNFTRRGAGKTLPAFFAFWNAGMQSLPLVSSLMSTSAGRYGLMALATLAAMGTESALNDPEDEDTDGGSKFARSQTRKTSLCFDGVCAQMPYEARAFMVAMQNIILYGHGKIEAGEAVTSLLRSATETFVPIQPAGDADPYTMWRMLLPTAAQPITTYLTGYNEFGGEVDNQYPVDWEGKAIANPANFERGKVTTPQVLKDMTRFMYDMSNGNIDISPARVDGMLSSMLGGLYNATKNTFTPPLRPVGWGDNGFIQTATSSFRERDNAYAVTAEYKTLLEKAMSSERGAMLREDGAYNVLAKSDPVVRIEQQRTKASAKLRVNGMNRSQLNGALEKAFYDGDEAAVAVLQGQIREFDSLNSQIYGQALQQLKEYTDGK